MSTAPRPVASPAGSGAVPSGLGPRGGIHEITAGPYRAVVCEVGATLNDLEVDGRPLILSSPLDAPMLVYRGALVAPWPNRIGDGRYTFDGEELQVPLSEPERGNALHGLLSFTPYARLDDGSDPASLTLGVELFPTTGYPFHLALRVTYALDAELGLTTTVRAENVGRRDLPFGVCPHPYVVAGPGALDTWTLDLRAGTVLQVSPDRLLPVGMAAVEPGSDLDFAGGRVIGGTFLDHAFTDLERTGADETGTDEAGTARVAATDPSGTGVEISFGPTCPWVQVHTGDRPEPELHRKGLAVEPMTCPPDAFNSGTDLVRLAPGAAFETAWRIRGL